MFFKALRLAASALVAITVLTSAARADDLALIDRPITLPAGALNATLLGNLSNWGGATVGDGESATGESLALGVDFGVTSGVQLGIAAAFPINPNAGFGSVLASGDFALRPGAAIRLDAGYERLMLGGNGGTTFSQGLFFAGLGAPQELRLSSMVALVFCKTGAVNFGHFTNIGSNGTGLYLGASTFANNGADIISVATSTENGDGAVVNFNLPFGLLVQPDPRFAFTLHAGYNAVVSVPSSGSAQVSHFVPIGLDLVVSQNKQVDVGASFTLAGFVASSESSNSGYADIRMATLWLRWRV